MPLDRAAFVGNYVDETQENILRVDDGVLRLNKDPEDREELNVVLRALHTIKGSSRMLKFRAMEQLAHGTENLFKGMQEGRCELNTALMQLVFVGNGLLRSGVEAVRTEGEDAVETEGYLRACERAYANEPYAEELEALQRARGTATPSRDTTGSTPAQDAPSPKPSTKPRASQSTAGGSAAGGSAAGGSGSGSSANRYESIRVRRSHVSEIIETLNTVIIKQFQFKQIQDELLSIERSHREALTAARKSISAPVSAAVKEALSAYMLERIELLKPLETLRKTFVDQISTLEQHSYKLQERIMRLTMLPMDLVFGELPRMVAETAAMLGKEIEFSTSGADILMDKAILEHLNDPIIHLVRNAVDHGIEAPDARVAAGKRRGGKIAIDCTSEAGSIHIRIQDDGHGIDSEVIRQKAVERGIVGEAEAQDLNEHESLSLIFTPGFSTSDSVTDLSGRGVGLDIVKYNIDQVKGKVTINSSVGEGTEFHLVIPLSLATVSGFFVNAGGERFLIPSNFVQKIVRLSREDTVEYYNKEAFRLESQIIPLYSLAALLGRQPTNKNPHLYVMVVESMGDRIGVVVDAVLQHESLIYKPVPRNMRNLRVVQGIVFDESYRIINILFIPELITRFKRIKAIDLVGGVRGTGSTKKRVLVVDDSLNTREIEKSILELEGYEVRTAADGIEGLERVKEERFDMIISDIEMPRMDGITMIENIRKDPIHAGIPIVVVTSHSEPAVVKRARDAGAAAHIVKSDFDRAGLVEIAERLLKGSTVAKP